MFYCLSFRPRSPTGDRSMRASFSQSATPRRCLNMRPVVGSCQICPLLPRQTPLIMSSALTVTGGSTRLLLNGISQSVSISGPSPVLHQKGDNFKTTPPSYAFLQLNLRPWAAALLRQICFCVSMTVLCAWSDPVRSVDLLNEGHFLRM